MTSDQHTGRVVEKVIDIEAPVEAVWKALVEADELVRWFPLKARVDNPGVGGSIWSAWDEEGAYASEATIAAWEPGARLVLTYQMPAPDGSLVDFATEYLLEGDGGTTRLRLVHSGFEGTDWDGLYDGTDRGWDFELRGLRHYLEHHRGTPRDVVHAHRFLDGDLEQAWNRLMGPDGLALPRETQLGGEGDRCVFTLASGEHMEGTVCIAHPPLDFAAVVENLSNAYLRVRIDHSCTDPTRREVNLWLSTYGLPQGERAALKATFDGLLEQLFGG